MLVPQLSWPAQIDACKIFSPLIFKWTFTCNPALKKRRFPKVRAIISRLNELQMEGMMIGGEGADDGRNGNLKSQSCLDFNAVIKERNCQGEKNNVRVRGFYF